MNKRVIVYVLGAVLLIEAALMLLPLLAAAVLSSASCSDDKEKEPPVRAVNYTIEFSTVSQAVYLGDKYQTGEGNYRLTLTNADGDVLEADLTSVKAPKPSAAMPTP